jgi:hypothetical protein
MGSASFRSKLRISSSAKAMQEVPANQPLLSVSKPTEPADRSWRQIAGPPLTPSQFHCATLGGSAMDEVMRIEAKNRAVLQAAEQAEIEANGYFTEPDWREVTSPDGVKCFVTRFRDQALLTPHVVAGNPDVFKEAEGEEDYAKGDERKKDGRVKRKRAGAVHRMAGGPVKARADRRSRRKFADGGASDDNTAQPTAAATPSSTSWLPPADSVRLTAAKEILEAAPFRNYRKQFSSMGST